METECTSCKEIKPGKKGTRIEVDVHFSIGKDDVDDVIESLGTQWCCLEELAEILKDAK